MFNLCLVTARKRGLGQGNILAPVCHSVHRGKYLARCPSWQVHSLGWYTPLGRNTPWQAHPLGQVPPLAGTTPSPWAGTPKQVQPPGRYPPWQLHPPGRYTSPWVGTPSPRAVHAGRYRQQAGSTHSTGMHSSLKSNFSHLRIVSLKYKKYSVGIYMKVIT